MADVEVNLKGLLKLLRERDHYSLPFEVRPTRRGVGPLDIQGAAWSAIDIANDAELTRLPDTSTWCTRPDVALKTVTAELVKGSMAEADIRSWFAAFTAALEVAEVQARVGPRRRERVPSIDDWPELPPPALSAFLEFAPGDDVYPPAIPRTTFEDTAQAIVDWCTIPDGDVVITRGMASFRCPPDRAATELLLGLEREPLRDIQSVRRKPQRLRLSSYSSHAEGELQVFDSTCSDTATLGELQAGLRIVAPSVNYAYVRRGKLALPARDDIRGLGRDWTPMEQAAIRGVPRHLYPEYALDAYVTQILTARHLEQARDLSSFAIEELAPDRFLVTAQDPKPWLSGLNPDDRVLAQARRDFGGMIVTQELLDANPPPWRR